MTNHSPLPADRSFLFVLGSSRADGNTEILARAAAKALPADVPQRWIDLNRLPLPDFQDGRHEEGDWPVSEAERTLRDATMEATDIVIASPLYWYTLSAQTKRYLDYWSGWLGVPGLDFKKRMAGRTLWAVAAMSDEDEAVADGLAATLNNTAAYLRMRFGGVLLGNGSRPGQVRGDERALSRARTYFAGEAPVALFPHERQAEREQRPAGEERAAEAVGVTA
ncbi:flavodoxin family protein [Streptomyces sp. NPDC056013]|uniref:flavodoxin family protein n=1 Tax=Streptomyces sp. NPDC056013 TaxID=3345680 RepID=UPI0035E2F8B8